MKDRVAKTAAGLAISAAVLAVGLTVGCILLPYRLQFWQERFLQLAGPISLLSSIVAVLSGITVLAFGRGAERKPFLQDARRLGKAAIMVAIIQCIVLVGRGPQFHSSAHPMISVTRASIMAIQTALDIFESDVGRFPTTEEGLDVLRSDHGLQNWKGPYIRPIPTDPWGQPFLYSLVERKPRVCSSGPDTKMNTADDITN